MWIQSLNQKDPLENGMGTHSSILAWRIPRTEEPGRPQSIGSKQMGANRGKCDLWDRRIFAHVRENCRV